MARLLAETVGEYIINKNTKLVPSLMIKLGNYEINWKAECNVIPTLGEGTCHQDMARKGTWEWVGSFMAKSLPYGKDRWTWGWVCSKANKDSYNKSQQDALVLTFIW